MSKESTLKNQDGEKVEESADIAVDSKAQAQTTTVAKSKPRKKKAKRSVSRGQVHILATFNNTIISVTDDKGNVLASASAGSSGFQGSKKGTAYAAQVAAEKALGAAKSFGVSAVDIFVNGIGLGREAAIRTLVNQKIVVDSIRDVTAVSHGGTRPRKSKRN